MTKKRCLVIGLLTVLVAAAILVVLALLPAPPGVTRENFDRIEIGMSRAEVEVIFGGPAIGYLRPPGDLEVTKDCELTNEWASEANNDAAVITLDADGRVAAEEWFDLLDVRTTWEKLLNRLPSREKPPRAKFEVL